MLFLMILIKLTEFNLWYFKFLIFT